LQIHYTSMILMISSYQSKFFPIIVVIATLLINSPGIYSQSLDIPAKGYGLSFGNSKNFSGIRFNFRDRHVEEINGINFTLWRSKENKDAIVNGISIGIFPEAGHLYGIQIGGLGVSGDEVSGITLGLIGAGSEGDLSGICIGGIGVGAGNSIKGLSVGLVGAGAGNEISGISIGGLGAGAGNNCSGIMIGGLGAGAGNDIRGITIGGLGAGAGNNVEGITIGGLGAGAGDKITGITIGGLGAGSGNELTGIAIGGVGVGAPNIKGLTIGGLTCEGQYFDGVALTLGRVRIKKEGHFTGFSAGMLNQIEGRQSGLSIGIVNYAWELNGIQIGLINYVRDNPKYLKVLPLFNAPF
jgi:hypothetical protein